VSSLTGIKLGDTPTPQQVLEHARMFLQQGLFRDAFELCKTSRALGENSETRQILRDIEVEWAPKLRSALLNHGKTLMVAVTDAELAKLMLTAQERYLLSRLDGKRDVDAIVRIAPLSDFESLSSFDRFLAQGLVRFVK
jgi:hypothetical protein